MSTLAKTILVMSVLFALLSQQAALGCAVCYGASDSPLAQGMNWGIMVLLGFIGSVLAGVSLFFVHVLRRAAALERAAAAANKTN